MILNVLLERIEPFNTVQCILYAQSVVLESIDLIVAHYAGIICLPIILAYLEPFITYILFGISADALHILQMLAGQGL